MAAKNLNEQDLIDILNEARDYNPKHNITGCLLYHREEFTQILEGQKEVIVDLYNKISRDKRNTHVTLIELKEAKERLYPDWSMAFQKLKNFPMSELRDVISLAEFENLHELKKNPSKCQRLFYYIGRNIIEH